MRENYFIIEVEQPANVNAPLDFFIANYNKIKQNMTEFVVGTFITIDLDLLDTFTYEFCNGDGDADNEKFFVDQYGILKITVPVIADNQ